MAGDNFMWIPVAAKGGLLTGKAAQPEGETTDKWFKKYKAFELKEFGFGVKQAETTGSASTGAGAGKVEFEEFTIGKSVDLATVPLYQACVAGAHFDTVMIAIRKAGGAGLIYAQFMFRQVFVKTVDHEGGSGDEPPTENITFKFGAMGIRYVQQLADGGQGTKMEGMWNCTDNSPSLNVAGLGPAPPYILNVTA
jgi:type VI secretion system secreted protein Hcp